MSISTQQSTPNQERKHLQSCSALNLDVRSAGQLVHGNTRAALAKKAVLVIVS